MNEAKAKASSNGYVRFLTSHAEVLLAITADPDVRIRDLASRVGITERRAQELVSDLVEAGYVTRERIGRRNRYRVERGIPLDERMAEIERRATERSS